MNVTFGPFDIAYEQDETRLHVDIGDIYICINRTQEGLIIDVYRDQDDAPVVIGTMALDNDLLFPENPDDQ